MKTIDRTSVNTGKINRSKQPLKAVRAAAVEAHPSFLAIVDRESGDVVQEIPLTDEQFGTVVSLSAIAKAKTPAVYIGGVVMEKVNRPTDGPISELEMAITQASALMQLLVDKLEYIAEYENGGSQFSGEHVKHFVAGIGQLVYTGQQRLDQAFNATFRAIHGPAQEVAA